MIPVWQMVFGVCVGLVALLLVRPPQVGYHQERRRKSTNSEDRYTPGFNSSPGDDCVICLMELENENMTYLPCGHALHDNCIEQYKRHKKNCPICREPM
ncbi:PREDICTED: E3 ubiquitin-protein ligase RNF13-like [Bactrocera latifrons]|uniref:E3 ubiquitin-protein ligase RNF13-like n=1 Tax=Bactrocera latifrons TaxID=174628 RepID=UPI0008DE95C0|nr:PREDICTED: E3 ubiquitin-protein ligase RNF13-like [Bactrocera latifrons]